MKKLTVKPDKSIQALAGDIENLIRAKTGKEIKYALSGFTIVPFRTYDVRNDPFFNSSLQSAVGNFPPGYRPSDMDNDN